MAVVKVKVKVVGIDQNSLAPVVIITDQSELSFIPIVIGPSEAYSINMQLSGARPPRPLTHDLMQSIIRELGASVERVVISDLKDETYYARLYLKKENGEVVDIDARPSDAIALALRTDAPIYISDEVAATAMLPTDREEDEDQEMEEFRDFLRDLTPDDFRRHQSQE